MKLNLCVVLLCVFSAKTFADITYHVAKVESAETVYEPKAEHRYAVTELQPLSRTSNRLPTRFTVSEVVTHDTVSVGNWILTRYNSTNGIVHIVDVADPNLGFVDSEAFWQVFYTHLRTHIISGASQLGVHRSRIGVSMFVLNDGEVQLRYSGSSDNLSAILIDYYTRQLMTYFVPFLRSNDEKDFVVSSTEQVVSVYSVKNVNATEFLSRFIDPEEKLPSVILRSLREKTSDQRLGL